MKKIWPYIIATIVTIPLAMLYYGPLNPPQCPASYTQAQVDASNCVIGANIGGMPILIVATIATWAIVFWICRKIFKSND